MKYVKVQDNLVVQTQQEERLGFIEAPDYVVPGFAYYEGKFSPPPSPFATFTNGRWVVNTNAQTAYEQSISRRQAIEAARQAQGLRKITIAQAETYINEQLDLSDMSLNDFDAATTQAQLKTAIRALFIRVYQALQSNKEVHLRELPYILE